MRRLALFLVVIMLSSCSSIKQAQFQSARHDAQNTEAQCHVRVMGVDTSKCFTHYDDEAQDKNDPYFVNVERSQCMADAWRIGALNQPDRAIAADMNDFADMLISSAHDVEAHRDTTANRYAKEDAILMDKFQWNRKLARAQMQCHTTAMQGLMSRYAYPGQIASYNTTVTQIANDYASGSISLEKAKQSQSMAFMQLQQAEQMGNAQEAAESSAFWQRMGNGFRALGQAQQNNSYSGIPAAAPMPVQTNCHYSGSFGGSVQCMTQ